MHKAKFVFGLILIAHLFLVGFGLPKNVEKRVLKELQKTFQHVDLTLDAILVPNDLNERLPQKINATNFFGITAGNESIGFVFVDKASSKTAKFDYMVIFSTELKIINTKVLIYREEYGGEIGSKRWLKQFIGKSGIDRVDHKTNIDGIAGATISVRSMTMAIDDLLQTIGQLQENHIL